MKLEIKEFESDFEVLHQFLIGEQVLLLHQLEERYESLLARQSSNIGQLEEQSAALGRLIAEAEDKSKQDGLQLLKVWGFLLVFYLFPPFLGWEERKKSHSGITGGGQSPAAAPGEASPSPRYIYLIFFELFLIRAVDLRTVNPRRALRRRPAGLRPRFTARR